MVITGWDNPRPHNSRNEGAKEEEQTLQDFEGVAPLLLEQLVHSVEFLEKLHQKEDIQFVDWFAVQSETEFQPHSITVCPY